MPSTPNRLQPDTSLSDNLSLINDNFDKSVSDINDLGAKFSSIGTFSVTLAANSSATHSIGITDPNSQYVVGSLPIVPRVEVWVDNNGNDAFLLGFSNSLSAGQANALVSVWVQRRAATGTDATFTVQTINFDSASHTYFFSVDESYTSSPAVGNFR